MLKDIQGYEALLKQRIKKRNREKQRVIHRDLQHSVVSEASGSKRKKKTHTTYRRHSHVTDTCTEHTNTSLLVCLEDWNITLVTHREWNIHHKHAVALYIYRAERHINDRTNIDSTH